jgi:Domain of unknown function (DUF4157)
MKTHQSGIDEGKRIFRAVQPSLDRRSRSKLDREPDVWQSMPVTTHNPSAHAAFLNRMTNGQPGVARESILQMQRTYGNRYVQRVLSLARKGEGEGEREINPEVEAAIEKSRGGGQTLEIGVCRQMESAFGVDFSGVRVHTDAEAHSLNHAVNAIAFTTGQDIFFRDGAYEPTSSSGRELLAHELTHVVQQGGSAPSGNLVLGEPGDVYEREAEQAALSIQSLSGFMPEAGTAEAVGSASPVQRQCACGAESQGEECPECRAEQEHLEELQAGAASDQIQRKVVCPPGVSEEDGSGCYEVADDSTSESGESSSATSAEQNSTPAQQYSSDPMQGGSSQGPPPADGGFTPAPGAQSRDPQEGGSSQAPPDEQNFTPAKPYSFDPMEGGSSQGTVEGDGGFTPAPGAQSYDPDQGGSSQVPPCDRAKATPEYQKALQHEQETGADAMAAKAALDQAKKMKPFKCMPGGTPDPAACANADWDVQRTQTAYDSAALKNCHAIQATQQALKDGGCPNATDINC